MFDERPESPRAPSTFRLSETFGSIQGEGPSAGEPCFFIRLAHCNLACRWCDTRYTWDFEQFDYHKEVSRISVASVAGRVIESGYLRLVVTGGEPLLQQRALIELLSLLPETLVVEVETNGTMAPEAALLERVNQWNVSPKLASSGEPVARRLRPEVLALLRDTGRAWLKVVVAEGDDPAEVDALVDELRWPRARVLLMPEGARSAELLRRAPRVQMIALRRGYGTSPRLHVERFEGERGR